MSSPADRVRVAYSLISVLIVGPPSVLLALLPSSHPTRLMTILLTLGCLAFASTNLLNSLQARVRVARATALGASVVCLLLVAALWLTR